MRRPLFDRSPGRAALAAACCGLLLAGCGRPRPAGAPAARTKVVLQLDWYPQPEHGGFYQALVKGYYRAAGLDVEIRSGGLGAHPQQMLATGKADFAVGSSSEVIVGRSRGIPLVMVGALMQRDPQAVMFHRETGIRSFKDLDGRRILAVPGLPFLAIIEKTFAIKLRVTPLDFGMSRFLADPDLVQQCFVIDEPYYARQKGARVGVLLVSDSGFSPYHVWYARRDFIDRHPDVVRAFTAASIRGWREYIQGDRTLADARIASLNPRMTPAFMDFSVRAMRAYRLVAGDPAKGEAVGRIQPGRIQREIGQLAGIGLLDRPVSVAEVYDSRFQP